MRILVTNDDGIHSHGLDVCEAIARTLSDEVWVVAPETDQSGVAHSLSLNDPLRLRQVGDRHFAVRGTPSELVIMGSRHLLDGKDVDLVLSGVNRGRNVGEDVIYSGTVAGAMEGTILGIPSFALSQSSRLTPPPAARLGWQGSRYGPDIIRKVLGRGLGQDVLININFPDCRPEEVKGIAVSTLGQRGQQLTGQGRRWPRALHIVDRLFQPENQARSGRSTIWRRWTVAPSAVAPSRSILPISRRCPGSQRCL